MWRRVVIVLLVRVVLVLRVLLVWVVFAALGRSLAMRRGRAPLARAAQSHSCMALRLEYALPLESLRGLVARQLHALFHHTPGQQVQLDAPRLGCLLLGLDACRLFPYGLEALRVRLSRGRHARDANITLLLCLPFRGRQRPLQQVDRLGLFFSWA